MLFGQWRLKTKLINIGPSLNVSSESLVTKYGAYSIVMGGPGIAVDSIGVVLLSSSVLGNPLLNIIMTVQTN